MHRNDYESQNERSYEVHLFKHGRWLTNTEDFNPGNGEKTIQRNGLLFVRHSENEEQTKLCTYRTKKA